MIYQTVRDCLTHVKEDNGWGNTTTHDNRIRRAIRRSVEEVQAKANFDWSLRAGEVPLVSGVEKYALPYDVLKLKGGTIRIGDTKISGPHGSDLIVERRTTTGADNGEPEMFSIRGTWPVTAQPAAAVTVGLLSDSGADTLVTVTIRGRSDGLERYEVVTVTSTVTVYSTLQYTEIYNLSKQAESLGVITAYEGVTTTELVRIPPQAKQMAFRVIQFDPIPGSAATLYFDYYRNLEMALQLGEAIPMPPTFERLVYSRVSMFVDRLRRDWDGHRADAAVYLGGVEDLVGRDTEDSGFIHPAAR